MRYYTKDHEWLDISADNNQATTVGTIGITDVAVDELGDIVHLELPNVSDVLTEGDEIGTIESVKTVSSLYAPVSGKVTAVNTNCVQSPEIISEHPYTDGWLVKLEIDNPEKRDHLLSESDYKAHCAD